MDTIKMTELRPALTSVLRDVQRRRRPGLLVTSGGTPMAALVPVTLEGRLDMAVIREIDGEDQQAERVDELTYDFDGGIRR